MKFYKVIFKLAILSRWTLLWSKFYRKFFQKKYKNTKLVRKNNSPKETEVEFFNRVSKVTDGLEWKKDDWTQLWDVISSPQFVQAQINRVEEGLKQENKPLDCDDFSVYFANIIAEKFRSKLLAVAYKEKSKLKFGGHAVCLVQDSDYQYYHLSNWGLYGPFNTVLDAVDSIYQDREYIGYALFTKDLKLEHVEV